MAMCYNWALIRFLAYYTDRRYIDRHRVAILTPSRPSIMHLDQVTSFPISLGNFFPFPVKFPTL